MPQPRFQQVYDASSFAAFGPIIRIDEISFTQETVQIGNPGLLGGDGAENCSGTLTKCGLFTITLSTTSKPVNGLLPEPPSPPDPSAYTSMAEFNANGFPILEGLQVVFAQQILLSDYYDSGLGVLTITTLTGSPFFYDPNDGNLIIDIQITDFGTSNDLTQGASSLFFNATDDKDLESEPGPYSLVNNFDGRDNDSYGLATAFELTLVPEPSAGILLGLGLVGLGCLRRGRRAQR
jgi:hypothetical protein